MIQHTIISKRELHTQIKQGKICFAGNLNLKIFGRLNCASGKRITKQNRVFFCSVSEAIDYGFRPCGHCMLIEYKKWKDGVI